MRTPLLSFAFFFIIATHAQDPGDLDPSFDTDGIVLTPIGTSSDAVALAIQPDQRIVVVGRSGASPAYNGALARYNTDGTLDNDFGVGGQVTTDLGGDFDVLNGVVIQTDGKVIACGGNGNDFVIVRTLDDGTPDPAFDGDGLAITDFGTLQAEAVAVALQPDGKILAAGFGGGGYFCVARYNTDGTPDLGFSSDGQLMSSFGGVASAQGVAVQPDGRILVAGGNSGDYAFARYETNGALDVTFGGGDGLVIVDEGGVGIAQGVVVQPDGRIVAAGGSDGNFCVMRLNADGTPDTDFSGNGFVTTDVGDPDLNNFAEALCLQPDGKIVVAGAALVGAPEVYTLVRYTADGTVDAGFGTGGIVHTDLGGTEMRARGVRLQADGRIVVAGSHYYLPGISTFGVCRYFSGLEVGIEDQPMALAAVGLFPVPAHENLVLTCTLDRTEHITATLLNAQGDLVRTILSHERMSAGTHTVAIGLDPSIAPGMYLVRISNGDVQRSLRLVKE